jgi:hypothetical protein
VNQYTEHVLDLMDELDTVLVVDSESTCSMGACVEGRGGISWAQQWLKDGPVSGFVFLSHDPCRGGLPYLVALHELGHIAAYQHPDGRWRSTRRWRTNESSEAHAWMWALERALVQPTAEDWRAIATSLRTYGPVGPDKPRVYNRFLREAERNACTPST